MGFFLVIFFILFGQAEASTVRPTNTATPVAYASNSSSNVSLPMVVDAADGSTENTAIKVYVPLGGDNPANTQVTRSILASSTLLPKAPVGGTVSSYVLMQLTLTNTTADTQYLWAAVKDTSNAYRTIDSQTVHSLGGNSTGNVDSVFDIKNICPMTNNCLSIGNATTASGTNSGQYIIYYFLTSSSTMASNTTIDPANADSSGGVYVKFFFSDLMPTGNTTINRIYNGDSRVFIDVTSGTITQMGDYIYKTMVLKHTGLVAAASTTVGAVGVSNIHSLLPPTQNGLLDVQNLSNNTDYYFSVSLVNKFSFHSPLSASAYARPEPIEALLQKQACFLLTAGFAGNHPVVEYFRHIRDDYLLSFSLGKSFVNSYYRWAPQYAQFILDRPWLATFIRGLAHSFYFILNQKIFFAFIVGLFIFASPFFIFHFKTPFKRVE